MYQNQEKIEEQITLTDLTYLAMENKCTAILDNNIITSNLLLDYDIFQKITRLDIDFASVMGLEKKIIL